MHRDPTQEAPTSAGILAVWNDRDEVIADRYEHWYIHEHLPERVGVTGWCRGRRYEAIAGGPRFFTYYETDSPAACFSDEYVARLNDPTPQTMEVMGHWRAMTRTVCEQVERHGRLSGAYVIVVRFERVTHDEPSATDRRCTDHDALFNYLRQGVLLSARRWVAAAEPKRQSTVEGRLRSAPDGKAAGAWVFDFMREEQARAFHGLTSDALRGVDKAAYSLAAYRFLCEYQ